MKKSLIALAVAGVFTAPAFAASSNVDIYGKISVSIDSIDNGVRTNTAMQTNNVSAIGVKGSEDLGGGLKAVWQIEANLQMDGDGVAETDTKNLGKNSNIWGSRNTYVGIAGGFGTVVAGVHDTPYKISTGKLDKFVGTIGDYNTLIGSAGSQANSGLFDLRTGNTLAYISPDFSGFSAAVAYVMGGEAATAGQTKSDAYSLSGTYANGPLFATVAYEKHNNVNAGKAIPGVVILAPGGSGADDRDSWKVGVGYTMGDISVGLVYENMDGKGALAGIEHDTWLINGAYKMGPITLKAEYGKADDLNNVSSTGADLWALGADYALSKRTTVQFTYASLENDGSGVWGMGQGATYKNTGSGKDIDGFSLGIVHSF